MMIALLSSAPTAGLPTSADLQHDLAKVGYRLATFDRLPMSELDDLDDIAWLRGRQRFLRAVLASRAAIQQRKIVDLAQWRRGGLDRSTLLEVA